MKNTGIQNTNMVSSTILLSRKHKEWEKKLGPLISNKEI